MLLIGSYTYPVRIRPRREKALHCFGKENNTVEKIIPAENEQHPIC